jgi:hypothetical protein
LGMSMLNKALAYLRYAGSSLELQLPPFSESEKGNRVNCPSQW